MLSPLPSTTDYGTSCVLEAMNIVLDDVASRNLWHSYLN